MGYETFSVLRHSYDRSAGVTIQSFGRFNG